MKKNTIIKAISSSALMILTLALLNSCKENNISSNNENYNISFVDSFIELDAYESKELIINSDTDNVLFVANDESIIKIVDNKIVALKKGETKVDAKVNGKTYASIDVYVNDDSMVPFLKTDEKTVNIFTDSSYVVTPNVIFKGTIQDATYKYDIANASIAAVDENGMVSGVSYGNTLLTITASFNGFSGDDYEFLKETIEVNVSENVIIQLNVSNSEIFNSNVTIGGINYTNEATLSGVVNINNNIKDLFDANVVLKSNDENIAYIKDNKVIGKTIGNCKIYAEYTTSNASYTSNYIDINVNKPLINVKENFDIDMSLSKLSLTNSFLTQKDEAIEKIFDESNQAMNIYFDGSIKGYDNLGKQTWIVETNLYRYKLNVVIASKIITSASELRKLTQYAKNLFRGSKGIVSFEGYYILGSNIDMNGQALLKNVSVDFGATSIDNTGFIGTFDGRGYTISNAVVSADNGGLFGTLNRSSIVENVCFKNAKVTGKSGLISSYCGGTIKNCYIEGRLVGNGTKDAQKSLLSRTILQSSNINHVIINYLNANEEGTYQSAIGTLVNAKEANFERVFVLNTTGKVIGTEILNEYQTFTNEENGQFLTYKELRQSKKLTGFNKYWSFGEAEITFSA
ncbi:MAG: hypothetical protein SOU19_09830 [Candidatus Caccosoma sp.]|nr:hypothetical protein [Candidatus Caccosoma sp.]